MVASDKGFTTFGNHCHLTIVIDLLQGDFLASLFIQLIQSTCEKQTHTQRSQPGLLALKKRKLKAWRTYPRCTCAIFSSETLIS